MSGEREDYPVGLDWEQCQQILTDCVVFGGRRVFRKEWSSNGPGGGAGTEVAYEWEGHYWTFIDGLGLVGPCERLETLLQLPELGAITGTTTEIWCEQIPLERLLEVLPFHDFPSGGVLDVNKKRYVFSPEGGFGPLNA